jgi:hypothetical protein
MCSQLLRRRAESGTNTKLASLHRDDQPDDADEADGGKRSSQSTEEDEHAHRESPRGTLASQDVAHEHNLTDVHPGIKLASNRTNPGNDRFGRPGGANEQVLDAHRRLRRRQVNIETRIQEPAVSDVTHDADDGLPAKLLAVSGRALCGHDDSLADRIPAGPVPGSCRRANDHDVWRSGDVSRRDIPTSQQWNS